MYFNFSFTKNLKINITNPLKYLYNTYFFVKFRVNVMLIVHILWPFMRKHQPKIYKW